MDKITLFLLTILLTFDFINCKNNMHQDFKNGNAKFAQEFYNVLKKSLPNKSNFVYSPLSLSASLGLLAIGAHGNTLKELQDVVHFPSNETALLNGFNNLFTSLENSTAATVRVVNGIFSDVNYELKQEYVQKAQANFKAKVQNLNYADPISSAREINNFVEEATNQKIKDIIPTDKLDDSTKLVLVNALYFKSAWYNKFHMVATRKELFYVTPTEKIEVDMMMAQNSEIPYAEIKELDAQVLALPYKDTRFSMLVILPNTKDGITALEQKVNTINLGTLHSKLQLQDVIVLLPKFKLESQIDMKSAMQTLGVKSIFQEGSSGLGRISKGLLHVDKIFQKVYIEVDEEGTEAAAATLIFGVERSIGRNIIFEADHPFMILLQHTSKELVLFPPYLDYKDRQAQKTGMSHNSANETATILFIGRVISPAKK